MGQTGMVMTVKSTPPDPGNLVAALGIRPVQDVSNLQVDGEAAESFIAEKRIGERIKHLRL
jgi:hypothetical protein